MMFVCDKCGASFELPGCSQCGNTVTVTDGIWQLCDDPDMMVEGEEKYIGYEYIGESYSGDRKYSVGEKDKLFAWEIAELTGDGIFLDLGCGDGCFTVPVAALGTRIFAADISNTMLKILQRKADYNNVSLGNVRLCRMNALHPPLRDNSIVCVVANSVLHLISKPEKVISEIHRVLRPGGHYVIQDDAPGKPLKSAHDNAKYNEIVQSIYSSYWEKLRALHIYPQKYSWKFDKSSLCDTLFAQKTERRVNYDAEFANKIADGFLPRFTGRGFSDQVAVPPEIHRAVLQEVLTEIKGKFGEDFAQHAYHGEETDLWLTIYTKQA